MHRIIALSTLLKPGEASLVFYCVVENTFCSSHSLPLVHGIAASSSAGRCAQVYIRIYTAVVFGKLKLEVEKLGVKSCGQHGPEHHIHRS